MTQLILGGPASGGLDDQSAPAGEALHRVLQKLYAGDVSRINTGGKEGENTNAPHIHRPIVKHQGREPIPQQAHKEKPQGGQ